MRPRTRLARARKGTFVTLVVCLTSVGDTSTAAAQSSGTPCVASAPASPKRVATGESLGVGFVAAVTSCMDAMHHAMDAALADRPRDDADTRFVAAMIAHHQGAVDMARQLLLYGRAPALRSLALSMIAEQQAEIVMLRSWRPAREAPATKSSPTVAHVAQVASVPRAVSADTAVPVSARDRVYTGDQVSNTISVIDPSTDRLLGQIRLGNPRPNVLSPLYSGQTNVHGLGFSPDHRTLAVISTGTNAVTLIETATNRVMGTVYVGRNPHEGFFTPNGKELWVTVRGADYISVIDPVQMREIRRVVTASGPAMVVFRPDGEVAFVNHSFTPELDVVDVKTGAVLQRVPVVSAFSPNLAITADASQLWITHKDVGKVTVVDARTYRVIRVLDTGPVTNHVTFAGVGGGSRAAGASAGDFAYVTVCGENAVKVYRRSDQTQVATIAVGACPHGVWSSGDGTKVYVGLQEGDAVDAIDVRRNVKVAEIPSGQSPQALVYVSNAVPVGAGTSGLVPLNSSRGARVVELQSTPGAGKARGTVWVRSLGPVDGIDVTASGLAPSAKYTLFLRIGGSGEMRMDWPLATVMSDTSGSAALVEAIAPTVLPDASTGGTTSGARPRLILVRGTRAVDPIALAERTP